MQTIGIRELKDQASQIMRRVREEGDAFEVTYHGRVIARIVPVTQAGPEAASLTEFWRQWDEAVREISARWPEGVSAVEAVREGRERSWS